MEIAGTCDICGKPAKHLYTCSKCGRHVCAEHYTAEGLCTICASKKKPTSGPASELIIPESAKPTTVSPKDIKH
ncbi:MAG: hypothetical protein J7L23_00660 [Candidatus Diapherotrites archaeon]|nr:hypothetical protein [Candidatus Diapherotrites archaeon]